MAVAVTDTRTTVSEADSLTGWTGSGGLTLFTTDPNPVEQTGCIGIVVSTATQHMYYTMGAGVNMSGGMLVYVWVLANGVMDTTANGGIQLLLGDGTNRVGYHIAGSDKAVFRHQNGSVGWQCLVVDTANLPTARTTFAGSAASLNLGSITQIGAAFKTLAKSVGGVSNCFVDTIRYGNNGLIVTSGSVASPGTFSDIATLDVSSGSGRAYGIIRQLADGVYGIQGPLTFGDSAGLTSSYFSDQNAVLVFEDRGFRPNKLKIIVTGSATVSTSFYLGNKLGTGDSTTGDQGVIIQAPLSQSAQFIASASFLQNFGVYGSTFNGFGEGIYLCDTASGSNHEFAGNTVRVCGQIDPGRTLFRNNIITSYSGSDGALLWGTNINIKNCQFTQNTSSVNSSSAVVHPATGTFTYESLEFSGNRYDIFNRSGGLVTINASGTSNPVTTRNSGSSSTTINNTVTHTVTDLVSGSRVVWIRVSDDVELENQLESSGEASYTYSYSGDTLVDVQILAYNYRNKIIRVTLSSADATLPASQTSDPFYSNPT